MPISPVGTVLMYDVDPTEANPATTLANVTSFNMDGDEVRIYEIVAMGDASQPRSQDERPPERSPSVATMTAPQMPPHLRPCSTT